MSAHTPGPWFIWKELAMQREGLDADEIAFELLEQPDHDVYAGTPTECTRGRLRGHTTQICTVDSDDVDFDDDEDACKAMALANARLIAAAPELLEDLKWAVSCLHFDEDDMPDAAARLKKAKANIAKATGSSIE